MASSPSVRNRYSTAFASFASPLLLLALAVGAAAQVAPTLKKISPDIRTDLLSNSVVVTLTGSGFKEGMTLGFDPAGVIQAGPVTETGGVSARVTLTILDSSVAVDKVKLWVIVDGKPSPSLTFNTNIANATCLETLGDGQCALLWEVETTTATGSSSQSSNNTTPNIIVKLDYQWHAPKSQPKKRALRQQLATSRARVSERRTGAVTEAIAQPEASDLPKDPYLKSRLLKLQDIYANKSDGNNSKTLKLATDLNDQPGRSAKAARDAAFDELAKSLAPNWTDHLTGHVDFTTGYTQVVAATKVQLASAGTGASLSCPGSTSTTSSACKSAVPQPAYVAEMATRFAWNTGVNDQNVFAEFGVGARGSFQYLIPSNKIVQSGGLSYIDLNSANSQNAVGFYEATGHFRLAQFGHDKTSASGGPGIQNASDLLVIEGGFQNNRGLQQLMTSNLQTDTRNRYVARFSVHPEIIASSHTQLTMGMEYSAGINGGPHVVQLFFGTNLNPAKLFGGKNGN